jgi:hypothetical protein
MPRCTRIARHRAGGWLSSCCCPQRKSWAKNMAPLMTRKSTKEHHPSSLNSMTIHANGHSSPIHRKPHRISSIRALMCCRGSIKGSVVTMRPSWSKQVQLGSRENTTRAYVRILPSSLETTAVEEAVQLAAQLRQLTFGHAFEGRVRSPRISSMPLLPVGGRPSGGAPVARALSSEQ